MPTSVDSLQLLVSGTTTTTDQSLPAAAPLTAAAGDDLDSYTLTGLTSPWGTEAKAFPFIPNWKNGVMERWEWKTDVLTSFNGVEQRISLRKHARREIEYELFAQGLDRAAVENMLWASPNKDWALPQWWSARALLPTATPTGTTTLVLKPAQAYPEILVGGSVALWLRQRFFQAHRVAAVPDRDTVVLETPVDRDWPEGTAVVPICWGRLPESVRFTRATANFTTGILKFDVPSQDSGYGPLGYGADGFQTTYRDLPVLQEQLQRQWQGGIQSEYTGKMSELDNGTSTPMRDYEAVHPTENQQCSVFLQGIPAIVRFKRFLQYCKGRCKEFWFPSDSSDFQLAEPALSGSTHLVVYNTGYTHLIKNAMGRRDIRITSPYGGEITYHRIVDSTKNGNKETLFLNTPLYRDLPKDPRVLISFLSPARLDNDVVEISYKHALFATSTFSVRTVRDVL